LQPQYRFVVVTSRQSYMEAMTKAWLDRHYPGVFDDVLFGNHYGTTGAKMGKPEMCSSIGAVCLIDDSLKCVFGDVRVVENAVDICTWT
jgi:hypothetical protein